MNLFLTLRALKYYLFSRHKNGHGIHSPHIFNLFSDISANKPDPGVVKSINIARHHYLNSNISIEVNDYGAGSLKIDGKQRRLSDIVRYSSTRGKYINLLSNLASRSNGKPIIELGTSLGIGTIAMAMAAPESKIATIEGCENIAKQAVEGFKRMNVTNIESIVGEIDNVLEPILRANKAPGLVFIDANHKEEALIRYFDMVTNYIDNETVIVIDDIHLSSSMERGWRRVVKSERVSVTVDLFQMGIVFFRGELTRENFVIRY
jgi:predicted O-methyltransferase YrrM